MSTVLAMFRKNNDTMQIATFLGLKEHEVYNLLAEAKEIERGERVAADKPKPLPRKAMWHLRNGALVFGPVQLIETSVAS